MRAACGDVERSTVDVDGRKRKRLQSNHRHQIHILHSCVKPKRGVVVNHYSVTRLVTNAGGELSGVCELRKQVHHFQVATRLQHLFSTSALLFTFLLLLVFFFTSREKISKYNILIAAHPHNAASNFFLGSNTKLKSSTLGGRSVEDTAPNFLSLPRFYNASNALYDAIVIGGGAAGCPLARTLAESGLRVLLVERGGVRREHAATLDYYGPGLVITDPTIAQLVVTEEGIRSHISAVLSGGTAINVGIIIYELSDYYSLLERAPGVQFNRTLLAHAANWTVSKIGHPALAPEPVRYESAWRRALDRFVGPFTRTRHKLAPNRTWNAYTLFDGNKDGYRGAADVTLGRPFDDFPPTLRVLVNYVAKKIEFSAPTTTGKRKARCVVLQKTTTKDLAPIFGSQRQRKNVLLSSVLAFFKMSDLSWPFNPVLRTESENTTRVRPVRYRACVNDNGVIISSAGAIMTPLLLFNSGVGPAEDVRNLGVPLVYNQPALGRNLKDRVMLPFATFLKRDATDRDMQHLLTPRICHSVGLRYFGQNCSALGSKVTNLPDACPPVTMPSSEVLEVNASDDVITMPNNDNDGNAECKNRTISQQRLAKKQAACLPVGFEVLHGSRMAESIFTETRYLFPPSLRQSAASAFLMSVITSCTKTRDQWTNPVMAGLCRIVDPIINCFRRVVAAFCFPGEVKSSGSVSIAPDGAVRITANYMKHPDDFLSMIHGARTLRKIAQEVNRENLMEPNSPYGCPAIIFNTFLRLVETYSLNYRSADAVASNASGNGDNKQLDDEKDGAEALRGWLSQQLSSLRDPADKTFRVPGEKNEDNSEKPDSTWYGNMSYAVNASIKKSVIVESANNVTNRVSVFNESDPEMPATFPIELPAEEEENEEQTGRWVRTFSTSLWHWVGSAAMGTVVDNNFVVKGFDNLMIVDASVLTNVTRMNPTATIMSLGRYAGLITRQRIFNAKARSDS